MNINSLRLIQVAVSLFLLNQGFAQQLHGVVRDARTSEPIPLASVYLVDIQLGTKTDSLGVFRFDQNLPKDLTIRISSYGYETRIIQHVLSSEALKVELAESHLEIDEVVVSTPGSNQQKSNVNHVELRNIDEINAIPESNLGDMIAHIPGVSNASTGNGVSKPVVRGLQGIRVVTMLNGLRIENQQWGGDHGMGITELGIGKVEVIKGPASLLYGADALGGVIYFSDEEYADVNRFNVKIESRGESALMSLTNQVGFKMSKGAHRFNLALRTNDHADYKVPSDLYVENSRFYDRGIKAAYGVNKGNWALHLRYNYFNSRVGIIGDTHEEEEEEHENEHEHELEFLHETQGRFGMTPAQQYENHYVSVENKLFSGANEYYLLIGQTFTNLQEFEESFELAAMNSQLNNSLYNFRWTHRFSANTKLIGGLQGMLQTNRNAPSAEEELVPDANQSDHGAYAIFHRDFEKWSVQGGIRYDFRLLERLNSGTDGDYFFQGVNFSAGTVRSGKKSTTRLNVSSGIRMPHLSEMFTEGEHHGAMRYEIGSDALKPEKGYQLDVTHEIHGDHFGLILNPYYNLFLDYIFLNPTDSVIEDLQVFRYDQMDQAQLAGIDVMLHYHPHFAHGLHVESGYSYIYGVDNQQAPLPLIPQGRINTQLKYVFRMKRKVRIEELILQHNYFMPQRKVADSELATVDYHLLDFGANVQIGNKVPLKLGLGVKNLLDQAYVNHLSRLKRFGISGPGRSFYVKLVLELDGKM